MSNTDGTIIIGTQIDSSGANTGLSRLGSLASSAGKAIVAGMAAATTAVIAVGTAAVQSYADYEQLVGGVETLFGTQGMTLEQYAQSVGESVDAVEAEYNSLLSAQETVLENAANAYRTAGMSENDYMENITAFSASLISSLEGDTEAAAAAADMAITDMADNANRMGTNIDSIVQTYQSLSRGNYAMLDNLRIGYGGTKSEMERLLADAQEISGIEYDISNLNDVYSAIHVIQTELGITGATAEESATTITGSLNSVKASYQNLLTSIASGDDVSDHVEILVGNVANFLNNLTPLITQIASALPVVFQELVPLLSTLIVQLLPIIVGAASTLMTSLVSALPQLLGELMALLPSIVQVILEMVPQIASALISATLLILNLLVSDLPSYLSMFTVMLTQILDLILGNLPLFVDVFFEIVFAIIDSFPQMVLMIANALPQIISTIVTTLLENIPLLVEASIMLFMALLEAIPVIIGELILALPQIWQAIMATIATWGPQLSTFFQTIWAQITEIFNYLPEYFSHLFSTAYSNIVNVFSQIVAFFQNIWSQIVGMFTSIGTVVASAITGAVSSAINFVLSGAVGLINGFIGMINGAIDIINAIPGVSISSVPSLSVPQLATGAVLPANNPFLAIVGDQKSGTNIEAPLDTIKQALAEVLAVEGNTAGNVNVSVYLEGDAKGVFKVVKVENDKYKKQTGASAFA